MFFQFHKDIRVEPRQAPEGERDYSAPENQFKIFVAPDGCLVIDDESLTKVIGVENSEHGPELFENLSIWQVNPITGDGRWRSLKREASVNN